MSKISREDNKKRYKTGMYPTQQDFENVFDSYVHKDDGVFVGAGVVLRRVGFADASLVAEYAAGGGGAWGIALLAAYVVNNPSKQSLPDWLEPPEATKLDDDTYECKYCGAHFGMICAMDDGL